MNHQESNKLSSLLGERAVAELLNLKVSTLRKWRLLGRGPVFCKVGGRAVRYAPADVEQFIASGKVK